MLNQSWVPRDWILPAPTIIFVLSLNQGIESSVSHHQKPVFRFLKAPLAFLIGWAAVASMVNWSAQKSTGHEKPGSSTASASLQPCEVPGTSAAAKEKALCGVGYVVRQLNEPARLYVEDELIGIGLA